MPEQPHVAFGRELRRLRLASGLSLTDMTRLVHYSKGQLSKVERGIKRPSRDLVRLCDAELGAEGALIALVPEGSAKTGPVEPGTGNHKGWLMQLSFDGRSWFQPVDRRQVMAAGAGSLMALDLGRHRAPSASEGTTLLEISRSLFDQYRRLGQQVSPEIVLPALIAQTHTLRELSTRAGSHTRQGLLRLGSRYAEYAGWLVQETGNDQGAEWWTRRAVELAAAGGDQDLTAYAMVRRALITLYRQDAAQTVALAQQAQNHRLPPRIRGLAAQREAQGHALAGDYAACMGCLDRARTLLARHSQDSDEPVIGTTNLPDPVAMINGWCLNDLGRPREAAEAIDREIARVPSHALRTLARYGARRALAHAGAGEIDHACDLASQLLTTVSTVNSATIAADLRRLTRILARHPKNASVRALLPELTTPPIANP